MVLSCNYCAKMKYVGNENFTVFSNSTLQVQVSSTDTACSSSWNEFSRSVSAIATPGSITPTKVPFPSGCCGQCTIYASDVDVNYWPVASISDHDNATITATVGSTQPVTSVSDGTTFTSPTIYLKFPEVGALNSCGVVGGQYTNILLGMKPDAISRMAFGTKYPMNFATVTPYSTPDEADCAVVPAGFGRPVECIPGPHETLSHDLNGNPILGPNILLNDWLAVPNELRDLDPSWRDCKPDLIGSYDPPRILVPANVLVRPSPKVDAVPTSRTATPAPSVHPPEATNTARLHVAPSSSKSPKSPSNPKTDGHRYVNQSPGERHPGQRSPVVNKPAQDPGTKDPPAKDPSPKTQPTKDPQAENSPAKNPSKPTHSFDRLAQTPTVREPSGNNLRQDTLSITKVQSERSSKVIFASQNFHSEEPIRVVSSTNPPPSIGQDTQKIPTKTNLRAEEPAPESPVSHQRNLAMKSPIAGPSPLDIGPQIPTATSDGRSISSTQRVLPEAVAHVSGNIISFAALASRTHNHASPDIPMTAENYEENDTGKYIINGQTITSDDPPTVPETPISAHSLDRSRPEPAILPYTADTSGNYAIGSQILGPGRSVTVSGTVISAAALDPPKPTPISALPVLTFGSENFAANAAGYYTMNGETLSAGSSILISGTIVSAPSLLVLTPTFQGPSSPILTLGPKINDGISAIKDLVDGQTLTRGGSVTVKGAVVSLSASATGLIIGTSTIPLSSNDPDQQPIPTTPNLGGVILKEVSSLQNLPTSTRGAANSTYVPQAYIGNAVPARIISAAWLALAGTILLAIL